MIDSVRFLSDVIIEGFQDLGFEVKVEPVNDFDLHPRITVQFHPASVRPHPQDVVFSVVRRDGALKVVVLYAPFYMPWTPFSPMDPDFLDQMEGFVRSAFCVKTSELYPSPDTIL